MDEKPSFAPNISSSQKTVPTAVTKSKNRYEHLFYQKHNAEKKIEDVKYQMLVTEVES